MGLGGLVPHPFSHPPPLVRHPILKPVVAPEGLSGMLTLWLGLSWAGRPDGGSKTTGFGSRRGAARPPALPTAQCPVPSLEWGRASHCSKFLAGNCLNAGRQRHLAAGPAPPCRWLLGEGQGELLLPQGKVRTGRGPWRFNSQALRFLSLPLPPAPRWGPHCTHLLRHVDRLQPLHRQLLYGGRFGRLRSSLDDGGSLPREKRVVMGVAVPTRGSCPWRTDASVGSGHLSAWPRTTPGTFQLHDCVTCPSATRT